MNDIIQNLQANCFNGKEYFCLMSENKLNALKELSKREEQENQQLKIQISAREEEYKKLENKLTEIENWLRPAILQLMEIAKQDYYWITDQQIDSAKLVPIEFTVMGDRYIKFEKLERGSDSK